MSKAQQRLFSTVRAAPAPRRSDKPTGLDEPSAATGAEHQQGLNHLSIVALTLFLCAIATYWSDDLAALRPWVPDEDVPIARLFFDEAATEPTDITSGSASAPSADLGAEVLANLEDEPPPAPPAVPAPPEQGTEPVPPAQRGIRIDPAELEGITQHIEQFGGASMDTFYRALERTARREDGAITRIAHFGDSSIALDGITQTARQRFQQRFGDSGHGFVLMARGTVPYRHHDVRHDSSGNWRLMDLPHLPLSDGRYGLGGYQARSNGGAHAFFATADDESPVGRTATRFQVLYQRHPRGGQFQIEIDDSETVTVDTRADEVSDEVHTIDVADGPHRFEVRPAGRGEARLYGAVLERDQPGVVYDSLGMVGARARRFLGFDVEHLRRQLALRGTDLVIIGYGGNDADDNRSVEVYTEDFRQVARLVRQARPEASCLLFAPLDQAERDERGRIRTMDSVEPIVTAMRNAAEAEGCAFYDTFAAMGGPGSMDRWFRARPRLAWGDFRHATPAGYRVLGNMFYKALLAGFADYLSRTGA